MGKKTETIITGSIGTTIRIHSSIAKLTRAELFWAPEVHSYSLCSTGMPSSYKCGFRV